MEASYASCELQAYAPLHHRLCASSLVEFDQRNRELFGKENLLDRLVRADKTLPCSTTKGRIVFGTSKPMAGLDHENKTSATPTSNATLVVSTSESLPALVSDENDQALASDILPLRSHEFRPIDEETYSETFSDISMVVLIDGKLPLQNFASCALEEAPKVGSDRSSRPCSVRSSVCVGMMVAFMQLCGAILRQEGSSVLSKLLRLSCLPIKRVVIACRDARCATYERADAVAALCRRRCAKVVSFLFDYNA
eukprot:TRINITY_DN41129_c0_g1_i1.p1 TRINITY_DN41129_c0_g1~~TRINITY_DN41129_c0_g1_i1.p1  ORF type:complete len:273 (+),score=10.01 TRINITY_DN41129_c0_g1_i1:62-820(+)